MRALVLGIALSACGPKITTFNAEPNVICGGSRVHLSWDATSPGSITASSPTEGIGDIDKHGELWVNPKATTRFHLEVSNIFGRDARDVDVSVSQPAESKVLGQSVADASAACDVNGISVTVVAPAGFWDPKLRVAKVTSSDGRPYHVEHDGRAGDVTPSASSNAFDGAEVAGEWKLRTPLADGESCGKKLPRSLMIGLAPTCAF
jgi:hypothetical protein